jgi:DNA integrity scanning protein DisA with diadenylate cyclase activity
MTWLATLLKRPDIGWADALDIAIVSFLLYELLLLIRGTRAVQMALSGGFLLLLYFLSQWLQLETVNWVIRNLAPTSCSPSSCSSRPTSVVRSLTSAVLRSSATSTR